MLIFLFLKTLASSINHFVISKSELESGIPILELLVEKMEIISSKTEGRKAIQNNSIAINKVKINKPESLVSTEHLIQNGYILLESGKKEKYMLILE